jgi:Hypothetical glycosyl hydrolase family 15
VPSQRSARQGPAKTAPRWTIPLAAIAAALAVALLPAAASASAATPGGNLVANPSFSDGTSGWLGGSSSVTRVNVANAPDGSHVAKVRRARGADGYSLDDAPDTVGGSAAADSGEVYVARAWAKGVGATRGVEITIAVTETAPGGAQISSSESSVTLTGSGFVELAVAHTTTVDGGSVGVKVYRADRAKRRKRKDQFLVDAISLSNDPAGVPAPPSPGVSGGAGTGDTTPTDPPDGPAPPPPVDPPDDPPPPPPTPPPPTSDPMSTTSQLAFTFPHEDQLVAEQGSRYRTAVVRDFQHQRVAGFEAANPDTDLLVYKNVGFVVNDPDCSDDPYQASGLSYCQANAHEEWFLHDENSGERIVPGAYTSHFAMDVGNAAYQQAWLDAVLERMRDADGDGTRYAGVWLDDTLLHDAHGYLDRVAMSEAQYRAAMQSFIAYVGPRLQQEGFIVMTNLALQPWDAAQRAAAMEVARNVTSVTREYFVRWGAETPLFTGNEWKQNLTLMEELMATGANYQGVAYGETGDVQAQRYARATFLLGWDGEDGSSVAYRPEESSDPYMTDWTTDIGVPVGPRTQVGSGWKREFSDGIVVINPSSSGSQTFSLGGSYRQPNGSCATSVTLSATRALVLPSC